MAEQTPLEQIREQRGPTSRPQALADDRRFVPGALYHWRRIHGLSQREAQARLGYSLESNTWALWESGRSAPPYKTLLRIISATGLGYWVDTEGRAQMDPEEVLEADRRTVEELRAKRRGSRIQRARRRHQDDDAPEA